MGHVSSPQVLNLLKTPTQTADEGQGRFGSQQVRRQRVPPSSHGDNPGSALTSLCLPHAPSAAGFRTYTGPCAIRAKRKFMSSMNCSRLG